MTFRSIAAIPLSLILPAFATAQAEVRSGDDPRVTFPTVDELPVQAPAEVLAEIRPEAAGTRPIFDPAKGEPRDIPLFWRPDLVPGSRIDGPAVIAEDQTSSFVPDTFRARIAANWYILLDRKPDW